MIIAEDDGDVADQCHLVIFGLGMEEHEDLVECFENNQICSYVDTQDGR